MEPPRLIDAASPNWNIGDVNRISAIVAINVIHISNFDVTLGILNGANKYLEKGGILYFYGPFFLQVPLLQPLSLRAFHLYNYQ